MVIETSIEISSTPAAVWSVLTAFESYADWNPFVRAIHGEGTEGSKLSVTMEPPGGKAMTFRPTVMRVVTYKELRWLGHVLVPGIFDGEHYFLIQALAPDRVNFVQGEIFKGFLVPLLRRSLDRDTRRGFELMNEAVKRRAEAIHDLSRRPKQKRRIRRETSFGASRLGLRHTRLAARLWSLSR
jgi:hypothetical protein